MKSFFFALRRAYGPPTPDAPSSFFFQHYDDGINMCPILPTQHPSMPGSIYGVWKVPDFVQSFTRFFFTFVPGFVQTERLLILAKASRT